MRVDVLQIDKDSNTVICGEASCSALWCTVVECLKVKKNKKEVCYNM